MERAVNAAGSLVLGEAQPRLQVALNEIGPENWGTDTPKSSRLRQLAQLVRLHASLGNSPTNHNHRPWLVDGDQRQSVSSHSDG